MDESHCFTCGRDLEQGDKALCYGCKVARHIRAELCYHLIGKSCVKIKGMVRAIDPIPLSYFWSIEYFWYVWSCIREKMGKRPVERVIELIFRPLSPQDRYCVDRYLTEIGVPLEMLPQRPSIEEHIALEENGFMTLGEIHERLVAVRTAAQTTPGVAATGSLGVVVEGAVPVLYRPSHTEEPK